MMASISATLSMVNHFIVKQLPVPTVGDRVWVTDDKCVLSLTMTPAEARELAAQLIATAAAIESVSQ